MIQVKIKKHYKKVTTPKSAYLNDAGYDLTAYAYEKKLNDTYFFNTGISIQPPKGYFFELYCRSSIYKTPFIMPHHVGIIDQDYTGIIYMPLKFIGKENADQAADQLIGERIGQLILRKQEVFVFQEVDILSETKRGNKSFGSSQIK